MVIHVTYIGSVICDLKSYEWHKADFECTYLSIYKWFWYNSNWRWQLVQSAFEKQVICRIPLRNEKVMVVYKALSNWNIVRSGRATSTLSGALNKLRSGFQHPISFETSASLNLMTVRSGDGDFDAGCTIFSGFCAEYILGFFRISLCYRRTLLVFIIIHTTFSL